MYKGFNENNEFSKTKQNYEFKIESRVCLQNYVLQDFQDTFYKFNKSWL